MNFRYVARLAGCCLAAAWVFHSQANAAGTTAFSYYGQLLEGTNVAAGTFDLRFQLFTNQVGGAAVAPAVGKGGIQTTNGSFVVELDFGADVFTGQNYWLEIALRPAGLPGVFTTLTPRQAITAVPYAIHASRAASVPWSGVSGVPPQATNVYSAGAGLALAGTEFSIASAGVSTPMLADGAVTNPKLAGQAVRGGNIADNQVVRAVNGVRDELNVTAGDNIKVTTANQSVQIAAIEVWKLTGNSGVTPSQFLGTTDNRPLELRVNSSPALRLEPHDKSPNLIAGSDLNFAGPNVFGAAIGGGGDDAGPNRVTDQFGTVAGGSGNQAGNEDGNVFVGRYATVGGGASNWAGGEASTVAGGARGQATGELAVIGGGGGNLASGYASIVSGGGGYSASLDQNVPNKAFGAWSTIGGGSDNAVTNEFGVVAGGSGNRASGIYGTILGGKNNATDGPYAVAAGGLRNTAQGSASFAAGYRAVAAHDGAFVWADGTEADFSSQNSQEFAVRATGGIRMVSGVNTTTGEQSGVRLASGAGAWSNLSDRHTKEAFQPVDKQRLLQRLAELPVQTWNYKSQDPSVRHIGVMAQDFAAAFSVGEDERHISTVDADGVAIAAIQGLYEIVRERERDMARKDTEIRALQDRLATLEQAVRDLSAQR